MFTYFFGRDFSVAISRLMLLSFVAVLPFIGGCGEDDNPIIDDEHDHEQEADAPIHADVDGFVLEVGDKEVYRQFQGTHSGGLTVGVGEEIEVHAVFLDANGAEAHLDEVEAVDEHGHEEVFGLGLSDYDSAIIEIHLEHGEEEHAEEEHAEEEGEHEEHGEEELAFGLEGLKAGETEIKLQLLHGDHPDFTGALLIPVTVQ
ncbi:MAG: hypothetical protein OXL96_14420 [Candidatus Poribacteria bacterium]|nr:hypothetical protein [Candidatus Poribacteria bacterium]